MLNPQVLNNIRAFMARVQLTGNEVPAFNQAMTALAIEEQDFIRTSETAARVGSQNPAESVPQAAAA